MRFFRIVLPTAIASMLSVVTTLPAVAEEKPEIWRHDFTQAWADAQEKGVPIILHFYADWCGPCRLMERNVLNSPEMLREIGSKFIAVKVNSDNHPELVSKFNIRALPSDVFIDPDGRVISQSEGYTERGAYVTKLGQIHSRLTQSRKTQIASDERQKTPGPQQEKVDIQNEAKQAPEAGSQQPVVAEGGDRPSGEDGLKPAVAAGDRDTAVESPASKITLGLDGYSPVALSKSRQWVRGKQEFAFNWQDVTYWMTSAEELREFEKNPRQFAPRLLGCDPVILWQTDRAIAGSTQFGAFFDGELYLFSTQDSRDQFKQNPIRYTQTRHVLRPEQVTRLR